MAQTYTLEEAAERLGISPEEFKRKLRDEWKSVRSFRDGPTLRFRSADIDELARSLGQASDPGLQLGQSSPLSDSSEELVLNIEPMSSDLEPKDGSGASPLMTGSDLDDFIGDEVDLSAKAGPSSGADSDVRLDLTPSAKDHDNQATEEISLDLPAPRSGVLKSDSGGKFGGDVSKIPGPSEANIGDDGSSEFELSLDADSDSFELQLNSDSSEEVDLSSFSTSRPSPSGVNLGKPADSGVSLESKKNPDDSDSDVDFELSIDTPSGGRKSGKMKAVTDSDSEFELTLDDNSGITDAVAAELEENAGGDIFETDFELPILDDDDSASEVISMDSDTDLENSDFDIAIDGDDIPEDEESASQVMLVDDSDAEIDLGSDENDAVVLDDDADIERGSSASSALRGVRGRATDEDDEPIRMASVAPAPWGALPAVFLIPSLAVVVLGGLMTFELIRAQWGYTQPAKPSDSIVRGMADAFGMKAE